MVFLSVQMAASPRCTVVDLGEVAIWTHLALVILDNWSLRSEASQQALKKRFRDDQLVCIPAKHEHSICKHKIVDCRNAIALTNHPCIYGMLTICLHAVQGLYCYSACWLSLLHCCRHCFAVVPSASCIPCRHISNCRETKSVSVTQCHCWSCPVCASVEMQISTLVHAVQQH
jgi:hypothetical protein